MGIRHYASLMKQFRSRGTIHMQNFDPKQFWQAKPDILQQLSGAPFTPDGYHYFVFQWGRDFYEERVEMAGITRGDLVLDAGCGYGQFSAGLCKWNKHVIGIDRNENMLNTAAVLKSAWDLQNFDIQKVELPTLPFPDNHFDHVWCAGVLMFTGAHRTIAEFKRVVKPGGRIYGNINRWARWLLNVARAKAAGNSAALDNYIEVLKTGNKPDSRLCYLEPDDLEKLGKELGLKIVATGDEGSIDLTGQNRYRPMFQRTLEVNASGEPPATLPQLLEFVLEKQ